MFCFLANNTLSLLPNRVHFPLFIVMTCFSDGKIFLTFESNKKAVTATWHVCICRESKHVYLYTETIALNATDCVSNLFNV